MKPYRKAIHMHNLPTQNKLINVQPYGSFQESVSARDLYLGLGLASAAWSRWSLKNIEQNEFFTKDIDWAGFNIMLNGNETRDFAVSIEFAKHIALMARTEKSHEYRTYLINCEYKKPALPDFRNPAIAARAWADEVEAKESALAQIAADKPKVDFAMSVKNLDGVCTVTEFAKALGYGRNKFFAELRDAGYLMANNQPYQKLIDQGLFTYPEVDPWEDKQGRTHPTFQTMITGKGQIVLEKKFRKTVSKNGLVLIHSAA